MKRRPAASTDAPLPRWIRRIPPFPRCSASAVGGTAKLDSATAAPARLASHSVPLVVRGWCCGRRRHRHPPWRAGSRRPHLEVSPRTSRRRRCPRSVPPLDQSTSALFRRRDVGPLAHARDQRRLTISKPVGRARVEDRRRLWRSGRDGRSPSRVEGDAESMRSRPARPLLDQHPHARSGRARGPVTACPAGAAPAVIPPMAAASRPRL